MNRRTLSLLFVFGLLIAIAVVGRVGQPAWNFTPLAAAALFAGRYFERLGVAVAVPLAALLISDLAAPTHISFAVMLTVYAAMAAPAFLGRLLRRLPASGSARVVRWAVCLLGPSALFYLTTNLAVWLFQSDYPRTAAGLVDCYVAAAPFYRNMLAGDLFYSAVLFGAAGLAGVRWPSIQRPSPQRQRS